MCLKMNIELAHLIMMCLKMKIKLADCLILALTIVFSNLLSYIWHQDQSNHAVIKANSVSCRLILSLGDKE